LENQAATSLSPKLKACKAYIKPAPCTNTKEHETLNIHIQRGRFSANPSSRGRSRV